MIRAIALERLAALTRGSINVGSIEQVFSLLTTDCDGFPRHSALSRNEVDVGVTSIHIAIRANRAAVNIERTGLAALVALDRLDILTFQLRLDVALRIDDVVALSFHIIASEADSLGVALAPPTFVSTPHLAELDSWDATRTALLAIQRR